MFVTRHPKMTSSSSMLKCFDRQSCALVSGNTNKSLRPNEGRKEGITDRVRTSERTTKRVSSRSLTQLLFRILQNSRKKGANINLSTMILPRKQSSPQMPHLMDLVQSSYKNKKLEQGNQWFMRQHQ